MMNPIDITGTQAGARAGGAPVERAPIGVAGAAKINKDISARVPTSVGDGQESVDVQSLYGVLSTGKDAVIRAAGEVRALDEARTLVGQARQELEVIVKSFPPFPPGSMEREQFLNSVAGIRAMIERLTFPPAQSQAVSDTFSQAAFVDSSATDASLQAGLVSVGGLFDDLSAAHAELSASIQLAGTTSEEEAYFRASSQDVGKTLHDKNLSIGQDARYMLGLLN